MNMPLNDMPIEELIRTARSYATSMTPITTYTEIMHELINRIDALRVRGKVLVNENAAIKCMNDCLAEELRVHQPAGAEMHLIWKRCETPLTDEAITAIRAEGVGMFAEEMAAQHTKLQSGGYFDRQVAIYGKVSELAESFATQLRQGVKDGRAY
ncbi:hypothetical protein [Mangrovibacter phragmitis]|uniref:hypothetical protein n=1 Tax=Mangrovibacter phragmitis TaxID=1691903 RepID=UPI003369F506